MSDKKIGCVNHDCDKCTKAELPVLPELQVERISGHREPIVFYDADQLQEYGQQCAAHAREQVLIGNNAAWKLMCEKMVAAARQQALKEVQEDDLLYQVLEALSACDIYAYAGGEGLMATKHTAALKAIRTRLGLPK